MDGIKVMIVDDDPQIRELLSLMLESKGYRSEQALNGQDALELITDEKPDLILMDIMMPIMSGIDATRKLKETPATRNIPIIMLTAVTESDSVLQSYEYGADHYLDKPIKSEQLFKAIDLVMDEKRRNI